MTAPTPDAPAVGLLTPDLLDRLVATKLVPVDSNRPKYGAKIRVLINPDGPDAKGRIEALERENDELRAADRIHLSTNNGFKRRVSSEMMALEAQRDAAVKALLAAQKALPVPLSGRSRNTTTRILIDQALASIQHDGGGK